MVISAYLMYNLTGLTWIRLVAWLLIGMLVYFGYGRRHSRVQQGDAA